MGQVPTAQYEARRGGGVVSTLDSVGGAVDSGRGSLRSVHSTAATPIVRPAGSHRASLYLEPSSEAATVI